MRSQTSKPLYNKIAIAQPGGANPSMVNDTIRKNQGGQTRMMVNQVGGVPYGGEAAPHKNIYISSFLEDLNSKDHIQEEARSHDSILEEKKETNLEQIELPNDSIPPTLEAQSNKINPSPSPLPATDSHSCNQETCLMRSRTSKSNVVRFWVIFVFKAGQMSMWHQTSFKENKPAKT